ncbi:MAG: radical SAM protein [candidate division NC10 bacterium]|nr:radical SAM protein [candidate division NC10 bacterium]
MQDQREDQREEKKEAARKEPALKLVAWESTRACRLACLHCRAEAQTEPHPDQLRKEEILRVIDEIASFSRPILIITGGDPLLRDDIFEVSQYADQKGLRPVMSPSGSHISPEVIRKMIASGIKRISMSLDGSRAPIHDFFRQVGGCFDSTLKALHFARQEGLPFQINTTITRHNQMDLPAIHDLVLSLGAIAWDLFMFIPVGRGKQELALLPEEYERTMADVHQMSRASPMAIKMTCAPQYRRVSHQLGGSTIRMDPMGKGCMSGDGFCFISHRGEVLGCGYLPLPAGNLRREGFQQIYLHSELFRRLRDPSLRKGKCGHCEFKRVCGGCRARALAILGDPFAEEPYCLYQPKPGREDADARRSREGVG